jgi:NH3-dependent NAD+ synthetase
MLIEERVQAIRDYHMTSGVEKAQLDVSGGIDSAVMAMLLVLAVRPENCIFDHTIINTDPKQTGQAKDLCEALKVPLAVGNFTGIYEQIVREVCESLINATPRGPWWGGPGLKGPDDRLREEIMARMAGDATIEGSIRSTLRAPLGRAYNRIMGGGIRHGTGNECEDRFLRFYQKGGDGEVDTNPLAMLSKTEVYQLAYALGHHLEVYAAVRPIIEATPSPDLWGNGDGHSDEAELFSWTGAPFTYGRIDPETGAVTRIGSIERVSRFLDSPYFSVAGDGDEVLDAPIEDYWRTVNQVGWDKIFGLALKSPHFQGFDSDTIRLLLATARRAERITRHKMNPNIPTFGTREHLIRLGLLDNNLTLIEEES